MKRHTETCEWVDAVDVGVYNLYRCMRTGKTCYGGCEEEDLSASGSQSEH